MTDIGIIAAVGAVAGGIGTIAGTVMSSLMSWRTHSGSVATTDADRLWQQNDHLIVALTDDNKNLRDRVHELEKRERGLVDRVHQAEINERDCNARNATLERKVTALERALNIDTSEGGTA